MLTAFLSIVLLVPVTSNAGDIKCKFTVIFEYIECMEDKFLLLDKELNKEYKILKNNLSKKNKKKLLDAQRLWIKYKEKNCELHESASEVPDARIGNQLHQGTIARLQCINNMTKYRAEELKIIRNNQ